MLPFIRQPEGLEAGKWCWTPRESGSPVGSRAVCVRAGRREGREGTSHCVWENADLLLASSPMLFKRSDHTVGRQSAWPWELRGSGLFLWLFTFLLSRPWSFGVRPCKLSHFHLFFFMAKT